MANFSNSEINSAIEVFYNTRNKLIVHAPTGSNVSINCEGTTINGTEISNSGTWYFYYPKFGRWTVSGTNGQNLGTDYVDIYEVKDYTLTLEISTSISNNLESSSWSDIQIIAQSSLGSSYWRIGDSKTVVLNGSARSLTFNNVSVDAYIIGFDHNSAIEGIGIHFQLGRMNSTDICFNDSKYNISYILSPGYNGNNYFVWCRDNGDGNPRTEYLWINGNMQQRILGQDINNPVGFLSCLPASLLPCLKFVDKYSTEGLSNNLLFLLSAKEVLAENIGSYYIYQRQYDYYTNHSAIKGDYSNGGANPKNYYLRDTTGSRTGNGLGSYVYIITEQGSLSTVGVWVDECVAPVFVVG